MLPCSFSCDFMIIFICLFFRSSNATKIWSSCGFEAAHQTDVRFFLAVEEDPTIMHTFLVAGL